MIWLLAVATCAVVLLVYRRMLGRVDRYVPARTHIRGWRSLQVADGSDTWVIVAFAVSFVPLMMLNWLVALVWVIALFIGMELLRRAHNNQPVHT
jgi:hypothetical protein